jgi:hypothetical protein
MSAPIVRLSELGPWDELLEPATARFLRDTMRLPSLQEASKKWKRGKAWSARRWAVITAGDGVVLAPCASVSRTKILCAGFAADRVDGQLSVAAPAELHEYSIIATPRGFVPDDDEPPPLVLIDHGRAGEPRTNGQVCREVDVVLHVAELETAPFDIGPHVLLHPRVLH